LLSGLIIVHQTAGAIIESLGSFDRVLDSGIHFIFPIFCRPRQFTWRKTYISEDGKIVDQTTTSNRIDLREAVFNFLTQEVYTKDTVLLDVNALMYYRITDIKKAIYEVDNLEGALSNTAQTQLKEVFGNMTFSEALISQTKINDHLKTEFGKLFSAWGIKVERMELLDLSPKANVSNAMKKQMVAERRRRGEFIKSEGNKTAMRLKAEGNKMVSVNIGIAKSEATRKQSEGDSIAKVELARAESIALDTVNNAVKGDGTDQAEYMIAQKYIELLSKAGRSSENQVIYFPYPVRGIQGLISEVSKVYGKTNVSAMSNLSSSALASYQDAISKEFSSLDSALDLNEKPTGSVEKGKEDNDVFADLN